MAPKRQPVRVFVVENSRPVMEALKALISDVGNVEIVGCAQGEACAQDEIRRSRPDVVVLDIRISGGSGLNILNNIRRDKQTRPVIIVFSGEAEDAYRRTCLKLGADYFFVKSSEFHRVAEVLSSLADRRA